MGLMSGTSSDGVDAALVRIKGQDISLVHHSYLRYSPSLRKQILDVSDSNRKGAVPLLCNLNFQLGAVFARAAVKCSGEAGIPLGRIDAIASHGQTVHHQPPRKNRKGSTLQIGEASVIAQRTGVTVISDFRTADMALGGQGAPLVPYADHVLFRKRAICCVHNIGGISNVTVVTPRLEDVTAFDTGPGNSLIDDAMRRLYGKSLDRSGSTARKGRPNRALLGRLLRHPYFSKKPPKSTGKETFGSAYLNRMLKGVRINPEDVVSTLTFFTARSIAGAYERFIFPKYEIREAILSGGGIKNRYLMNLLDDMLPVRVRTVDEFGIPSGAKEAICFAVLAQGTLDGKPTGLPGVTGARKSAILGKITPA
jgi:anhydro-N-acetylmuramic acid kinase